MRNFVIFFDAKEGTSAVVRLLDNFERVSVVHLAGVVKWEPFDRHSCGPMPNRTLGRCLDHLFAPGPVDEDELDRLYRASAEWSLAPIKRDAAVGFKMRFDPPAEPSRFLPSGIAERLRQRSFRRTMFDALRRHDVVVFLAVRQDVFRWALSTYHGDGTGAPGHLQFKLASGSIDRADIPPIEIDCDRFEALVSDLEARHEWKRELRRDLEAAGIEVYPLLYEEFCDRPVEFFSEVLHRLDVDASRDEIDAVLAQGTRLQKVHTGAVADFVVNAEEVESRFAERFVAWA